MGAAIFTITVFAFLFFGVWRLVNLERAQRSAFQKLANRYHYSYSKEDHANLLDSIRSSGLNLIQEKGKSSLFNIIAGNFHASTVTAFTYKHETDPSEFDSADIGTTYFTLVVLFQNFDKTVPVFSLFPKRTEINHASSIQVSNSEKFNKRYVLSSDDEMAVRSLIEPHADQLADHKVTQCIYCDGDKILFTYKGNCTGKVVEKRIDSAHEIFRILFDDREGL